MQGPATGRSVSSPTPERDEADMDDVMRIAEEISQKWAGVLDLMAQGPCDGCPTCPTEEPA